jgi:hypothetical protein
MDDQFSSVAARTDFARERRRQALAKIASRLRFEPDDVSVMLPFDEVVGALGRRAQTDLGVHEIPLDSIVGTVDRRHGQFDRHFRPASAATQSRWERIAAARRRGEAMPPIEVFRIGDLHFVSDGHHRVSVARALGDTTIEARVIRVDTTMAPGRDLTVRDLPLKRHERIFHERVPLPPEARARIQLSDEWRYAQLASLVEAWGFRASHARERLLSRAEAAGAWFRDEYEPVVTALEEAGIGGSGTETERYLRIALLRYLLLHTQEWTPDLIDRLLGELRESPASDDTLTNMLIKEMD